MDGAVDKDSAVSRRISDKEPGLVAQVTGVSSDHEGSSDSFLVIDFMACVPVGGIKSARESCHDLD